MTVEEDYPRFLSRGRTFVYVFPCRDEDVLKVGFSREPLERLRTLHRRYFEFFDLDCGLLVETNHLRDARRLERQCITTFSEAKTPAPLVIRSAAGGRTEWFRGIWADVNTLMRRVSVEQDFVLHAPLSAWLRARFDEWSDVMYDWSARMLDLIEYEHFNPPHEQRSRADHVLRDVLDAYLALGDMDIERRVPASVLAWYHHRDYFSAH